LVGVEEEAIGGDGTDFIEEVIDFTAVGVVFGIQQACERAVELMGGIRPILFQPGEQVQAKAKQ
jgi:hypothetical protein